MSGSDENECDKIDGSVNKIFLQGIVRNSPQNDEYHQAYEKGGYIPFPAPDKFALTLFSDFLPIFFYGMFHLLNFRFKR